MTKQMVTLIFLCFFVQPLSLAAGIKKALLYKVDSAQSQNVVLHCNVFYLTGEKIGRVNRPILPGQTQPSVMHHFDKGCNKGEIVVKCKLKETPDDYGIEHFWTSILCKDIESERCLELRISKENKLSGRYNSSPPN